MLSRSLLRLATTPMRRGVRGVDFVRNRFTNKGTAFTLEERRHLNIEGMLPPNVETLEDQVERHWEQFRRFNAPINKYQHLRNVMSTNVTLYYAFVIEHLKESLPIIYTPTVGEACTRYGNLYTNDHGLYIDIENIGNIRKLIRNSRKENVEVIVLTDGSRILGLGDLGVNGIGISIGKTSLYVAAGGISPGRVLPVVMDCGTDNLTLRNNPLYLGTRKRRCDDATFYKLLDEFMEAAKEEWPTAVIQFEDFSNNHCFDMMERYQNKYRCFNDDIQGTGAVVSAGLLSALSQIGATSLADQRIVFFGAGSAATGVAESIADVTAAHFKTTKDEMHKVTYFVDSKGLVTTTRGDTLAKHKVPWARADIPAEDYKKLTSLEEVVEYVKPTVLIGLSAAGGAFTKEIVEHMAANCEHPIIFPLSNPSSKAEIQPSDAYKWSNGKAIVASGSPFPAINLNGRILQPSQGNNLYIFPGVGLGCIIAQPTCIPQEVLVAAALRLAQLPSQADKEAGLLYPPIEQVRAVSTEIAVACIRKMQELGVATVELPDNTPELRKIVKKRMWVPVYAAESHYLSLDLLDSPADQSGSKGLLKEANFRI
ncbi:malate dehydrogenase (oxaloacetate-decarboxylating) [Strigomonas culicis]|uniref:Malate dehydrogenase (Oxaloacetate-decarboxylating) n=1 Tax=Strigomonas culicis TaxID=28005 RepID=S9UYL3_9TRYP|nr:malate dehydrogenase (oxaloacetate-decarboxylating) [Strigomonas culicis]|eukprot:EPY19691.1 malate dehydrogenase (oxaloacetate-decarboxylating) [Strigomonas culicis]